MTSAFENTAFDTTAFSTAPSENLPVAENPVPAPLATMADLDALAASLDAVDRTLAELDGASTPAPPEAATAR